MAIAGYELEINGGVYTDEVIDIGLIDPTDYPLSDTEPETEYTFRYRAYDRFQNFSAWSAEFSHTTPPIPTVPGDLASLVHHVRAKSIAGVADGDPLGTWEDLEGSGDLSSTGANRPTFHTNAGNPYVQFDGLNHFLKG